MPESEFFFQLDVNIAAKRIGGGGVVSFEGIGEWRSHVAQVINAEDKFRMLDPTSPSSARRLQFGRNGLLADYSLTILVVPGLRSLRRDFFGLAELVRDLPIDRGEAANPVNKAVRLRIPGGKAPWKVSNSSCSEST